VRSGGLIIVDNVVRDGRILEAESDDVFVQGVRRLFEVMGKGSRVTVTAVQTVGSKGHDGFAIARVN
jgi:predicted O-methyltransferase YrrM